MHLTPFPQVAIVLPAYNEERLIGSVLLKLQDYTRLLIVVDDGSRDDTLGIALRAGACVIRHTSNLGKGAALARGLAFARQLHPPAIVLIDADGQHLPEHLPRLLQPILNGEADLVIGSRYLDPCPHVPRDRRLAHLLLSRFLALASRLPLTDSQSGYRALSPRAYSQDLFLSSGFPVESEMQFWARERGLRVKEVPITVRYPSGPPKRSPWRQGISVLRGILCLLRQYRPLLYFSVPGLAFLCMAGVLGLGLLDRYFLGGNMDAISTLMAFLVGALGLVMLFTGILVHSLRSLLFEMLHPHLKGSPKD